MKLMVAGCSFSDRCHVIKSYGDYLGEMLGAEYIHEGAGCGSNARIWRVVTKAVMDGVLTSDDLLVVQYTEIIRSEMWTDSEDSQLSLTPRIPDVLRDITPRDKYAHGGDILRIKSDSHIWQEFENERKFLELHNNHHVSSEFAYEQAMTQNFNFQHMLHHCNIPTIFLHALSYGEELHAKNYHNFPTVVYTDDTVRENNHQLSDTDSWHINARGHQYIAQKLTDMKRDTE